MRWPAMLAIAAMCVQPAGARALGAQTNGSMADHLNLDKLQIVSLGVSAGQIAPSQVDPARIIGVMADYGEIAPQWRVLVNGSFWKSKYKASVVQALVDTLNHNLPAGSGTQLAASPISVYDVTFGAEARFVPLYSGELKPFVGFGLAVHAINADGRLIDGTLVERALDDIAAGAFVTTGLSLKILKHFGAEGMLRGDLLSGFRSVQGRVGATYYFGQVHGTGPR